MYKYKTTKKKEIKKKTAELMPIKILKTSLE